MGNGPYGDFDGPNNFEPHEPEVKDGRWTYTRGRPITDEGKRIVADQKQVYDDNFGNEYEKHNTDDRKPNRGIKRALFGKWN